MNDINSLAKQLKSGNEDVLGKIYEILAEKSIAIAKQHVSTAEDAEDAFHDAFLKAVSNIEKWDDSREFIPWFDVVLVNTCKNMCARKDNSAVKRFSEVDNENGEGESGERLSFVNSIPSTDEMIMPENVMEINALRDIMAEIVESLPGAQRQTVFMFYYQEMSVKDIASRQNVSEDTIKSRLNYARKKVKTEVEEYERKNGIRLHSIAPIPLLLLLCKSKNGELIARGSLAYSAAAKANSTKMTSGKALYSKFGNMAISSKIGIAVTVTAVVIGGTVGIVTLLNSTNDNSQVIEHEVEEDSDFVEIPNIASSDYGEVTTREYDGLTTSEKLEAFGDAPVQSVEIMGESFCFGQTTLAEVQKSFENKALELEGPFGALLYHTEGGENTSYELIEQVPLYDYLDVNDYRFKLNGDYVETELPVTSVLRYTFVEPAYEDRCNSIVFSFLDLEDGQVSEDERVLTSVYFLENDATNPMIEYSFNNQITQNSSLQDWKTFQNIVMEQNILMVVFWLVYRKDTAQIFHIQLD